MAQYFAGIDSGTQSTKVLIVDRLGRVAGRGQAACELIANLPVGHKEQHPRSWIAALREAFAEAVHAARIASGDIVAVGVSGQQHGFVPLDKDGVVIRPAKLWNDTSTAEQAERIMASCGGREAFQKKTGNALPPGFTASKILWLKEHEPANFARLAAILLPHDYINFWLTGEKRMEWGDASGTGLLDVAAREWCADAVNAIDGKIAGCLPPLRPSWEPVGRVRRTVRDELGLTEKTLVSAGGGDNMMGAIGTGNVREGIVTVSLGTSGTIYACMGRAVTDPAGEIAAFCDSTGKWLPLLCTMNVTVATELTRTLLGADTVRLNDLAAQAPPGADGLMLLPYFEGERVPNVPDGTGVWFGFNARTNTPGHMARAAMEGATLGLNYGFNRMRDLGIAAGEIRLTGGGSKSALWRQIAADVFGTPVVCTTEPEGAAFGAAIQARWAFEREKDPKASVEEIANDWVKLDEATRCEPRAEASARYRDMQAIHDSLSRALRETFRLHRQTTTRA